MQIKFYGKVSLWSVQCFVPVFAIETQIYGKYRNRVSPEWLKADPSPRLDYNLIYSA